MELPKLEIFLKKTREKLENNKDINSKDKKAIKK